MFTCSTRGISARLTGFYPAWVVESGLNIQPWLEYFHVIATFILRGFYKKQVYRAKIGARAENTHVIGRFIV